MAIPAIPSPVDPLLARAVGGLAYAASARARAAVRANLEIIAPSLRRDEREVLVRRVFVNQARNYLTTLRLPRLDMVRAARAIDVLGYDHVETALRRGRGIVFASAHVGPLPLVATVAIASRRLSVAVVAEEISPRLFEFLNRTLRGSLGGVSFLASSQVMAMARRLRRGEAIGMLADRPVAGARMRVPFFGREAFLPVGHLQLAASAGATLLPAFAYSGTRPRVEVRPALELATGRDEDATRENVMRWAAILEGVIASAPDEWQVFERFWR